MEKFEIQIPQAVHAKIMHWINKTDIEVSGFGRVQLHENGVVSVLDAYLLPQEGGAAHTDIDANGIAKLMYTTKDKPGELKWWWHSHVNMAVFWSGTDTATIKELGSHGWCAATVFNKKEETRSALAYTYTSDIFGAHVVVKDELPTFIITPPIDPLVIAEWDSEFTTNVKEKKWGTYLNDRAWDRPEDIKPKTYLAGEQGSLVDMTTYKSLLEEDADEQATILVDLGLHAGLLGYGIDVEAQALGMTESAYTTKLIADNPKEINKLTHKLERLMENGTLDKLFNTINRTADDGIPILNT